MSKKVFYAFIVTALLSYSCKKKEDGTTSAPSEPKLIFKFKFDSTQARLDNFGAVSSVPGGHGALSPLFNKMSAHYIELTPDANTLLGAGQVLYRATEVSLPAGETAIDFDKSTYAGEGEVFYSLPIKNINPGNYQYLRVSLAYQNYDIKYKYNISGTDYTATGTLASFIGYNTYVNSYTIKTLSKTINGAKKQGYWGFESGGQLYDGQAPAGATTVPNPIGSTSPIPARSCVVTGKFASPLVISGSETHDKVIVVSISTNKSFEWTESDGDNWYEPLAPSNEQVVDMGTRGMVPIIQ